MKYGERRRYNPVTDGDPEAFINSPMPEGLRWFEEEKLKALRESSVLSAAFTPFTRDFCEKVAGEFPPDTCEDVLAGINCEESAYALQFTRNPFYTSVPPELLGRFQTACQLTKQNEYGKPWPLNPDIIVPVGAYGKPFATAVAKAAGVFSLTAEKLMRRASWDLRDTPYGPTIRKHTFTEIPDASLSEGAQTIAAAIGLLLPDKVKGFEDNPLGGLKHLIDLHMFQRFAAEAASGVVVPMGQNGIRFATPIVDDKKGKDSLDPQMIDVLKEEREAKRGRGPGRLGFGCPVAMPHIPEITEDGEVRIIEKSGVQMSMEAIYPYIEYFYTHS